MRYRIRDTSHLLDIIATINEKGIPDEIILVSFDIVNMFPSIDTVKGRDAVRLELNRRDSNKPSTECVLEGLQICLYNINSLFDRNHLLQTNGTVTDAPNSCSYSDIAVNRKNRLIEQEQANSFKELFFLDATGTIVLFCGTVVKTGLISFFILKCIRLRLKIHNGNWKKSLVFLIYGSQYQVIR